MYMYKAGLVSIVNEHELYLTIVYFKTVTIIIVNRFCSKKVWTSTNVKHSITTYIVTFDCILDAGLVIWS